MKVMTKRDYIRKMRMSPLGLEGVEAMRGIVERHGARKVNEVLVDAFSASAFVRVYDALSEANQEKLRGLCPGAAMEFVWRLAGR